MKLKGINKLKIVLTLLLLVAVIQMTLIYFVPVDDYEGYIDAYDSLSYEQQKAVDTYFDRCPDEETQYDNMYSIIFACQWIILLGLGIVTFKLMDVKKI